MVLLSQLDVEEQRPLLNPPYHKFTHKFIHKFITKLNSYLERVAQIK